jgi:hypothetical protein
VLYGDASRILKNNGPVMSRLCVLLTVAVPSFLLACIRIELSLVAPTDQLISCD